ncbi:MAG: molybdopterin molybdotransferase MoeA [Gemmobacter sp.]
MIPVEEALARILSLAEPVPAETVELASAAGRVLARPAVAARAQPPFPASAMDGYAIAGEAMPGARFRVIGESRAGRRFSGPVGADDAVRIFTGAPVPEGATRIVIQEDADREGDTITLRDGLDRADYVRPAGSDFAAGFTLAAPRRLRPADLALLAAMDLPRVQVARRPEVALIATGDEIVMPGCGPGPDQITASNVFALKAMAEAEGAQVRMLPVARDDAAVLADVLRLAEGADVVVTVGGASVGSHDLVGAATAGDRAFWKIAMRPGKPLMAGRLGRAVHLGLPGNPVSAIVCGHLFLLPLLRALQGLSDPVPEPRAGILARDLPANGPRAHYMRARLVPGHPAPRLDPFEDQDSSRLVVLSEAQALLIRPVRDPARKAGDPVRWIPLAD